MNLHHKHGAYFTLLSCPRKLYDVGCVFFTWTSLEVRKSNILLLTSKCTSCIRWANAITLSNVLHGAKLAPTFPVPTAVRPQHLCFAGQIPFPGPALERSSSAESRKVKIEEAWKVCIYMYCRSSDALYPQPPLLPPGAFIKAFQLLRFSSSSSGVPTLILHIFEQRYWVSGSRNCRVLQAYCMFGFLKIIHVAGSAQCLFGSERFLHQNFP